MWLEDSSNDNSAMEENGLWMATDINADQR